MALDRISGYSVAAMERVLIAIASAMITGAIFLGAFSLLQFVWPLIIARAETPHFVPIFFGAGAILFAILAIIFRYDTIRLLSAIQGAANIGFFVGVSSLLPFLRPLVVNHHLAPAAVAMIFAGPFAIVGVVNLVILRRIVMLQRTRQ